MSRQKRTMDGNEAAAYVSYAFTEVATIYPITPSSPMAELVDKWSAKGKKNIWGQTVQLVEMQSEAGAVGAMHGALETGSLATTYTSSQGLLLMIPTIYRIVGQLHPGVFHVSARAVGTHAFSIFGEHSDVMSCRQTGVAMLSSGSVQEVMDLAGVAHLSAIEGRVPFMHFFDGFRTSHEIQKVEVLEYSELASMVNEKGILRFKQNALNPEHPVMRSTVQNPDIYFQMREAANSYYYEIPAIVEKYMNKINAITGRNYKLFNYYGSSDAERVIVAMGSSIGVIKETVDYLNSQGEKVGVVQVHLYRPFSIDHFLAEIPKTVRSISVLDRTKEAGSLGEPLYLDIAAAVLESGRSIRVVGGRYGLSIKDVTHEQILAVFANMKQKDMKHHFTVGIQDDVTYTSLPIVEQYKKSTNGLVECKFWGIGSDGTVGANKNSIKIIGDNTDKFVQAYFEYDSKKSGGLTRSHLRFGDYPIEGSYLVHSADFIACHNQGYIQKYDILDEIKQGGVFLLNTIWSRDELEKELPTSVKRILAEKAVHFYTIDATHIGKEIGLGNRINIILQAAFFKLANIIPLDEVEIYLKDAIRKSYGNKGEKVVAMNIKGIEEGFKGLKHIDVPESWKNLKDIQSEETSGDEFVTTIMNPINKLKGDMLPVSSFVNLADGTVPLGTTKYEKRGVAVDVPQWNPRTCLQCNQCAYVCPHAAIRPFLLDEREVENAPEDFNAVQAKGNIPYYFKIQVSPLDCMGCGVCVEVCPSKEKSLAMIPRETQDNEIKNWEYAVKLSFKGNPMNKSTVKGSQFEQPLLEFSGACAGCGETPYMKLLTQLYGNRLLIANATGCTQAWGGAMPSIPYTTNYRGHGPAWSNSLFENNAEFALGMVLSEKQKRSNLKELLQSLKERTNSESLRVKIDEWIATYSRGEENEIATTELICELEKEPQSGVINKILREKENLSKKSIWMYGGDGWAYDIGYGGLDHVIASGENINILIVDTEVYSNTGGQSSKASPRAAVAQFASSGKKTKKKDLGMLAMTYGDVYVAQVAMGANQTQLINALQEAEAYDGPAVIIAYAPCINHGLVSGMSQTQVEMKKAVESGYWHLYRYNPMLKAEGKNPFILDSKEPSRSLRDFMKGEVRYASLARTFPEEAERLMVLAEEDARNKYNVYNYLSQKGISHE